MNALRFYFSLGFWLNIIPYLYHTGKGIKNTNEKAAILGSIAGAQHVRLMAKHYNVPVVLHSDHCAKKLLPWFDGMLEANEEYFKAGLGGLLN